MGLRERQLIREFQEEKIPALTDVVKETTGGLVLEWDVDWDTFAPSEYALLNLEHQGFDRIVNGIRPICYNDYGKTAVREGLKKITIRNVDDVKVADISFDKKAHALVVHGAWGGEDGTGYPDDIVVRRVLEDNL